MHKELRALIGLLVEQGFEVRRQGNGHYRVTRDGNFVVVLAATPSEKRGNLNARAALRRAGFEDPKRRKK